jgi:hypothetical protein
VVRLVITGCARSGTRWISCVLDNLGIKTTHEEAFSLYGYSPAKSREVDVDVSWCAAPLLHLLHENVTVWHQVRDPRKVVRCCLHNRYFAPEIRELHGVSEFVSRHIDLPDGISELEASVRWWYWWNKLAEKRADSWYQVEEMNAWNIAVRLRKFGFDYSEGQVHDAIGRTDMINTCSKKHTPETEVSWDDILGTDIGPGALRLAGEFGYDTESND